MPYNLRMGELCARHFLVTYWFSCRHNAGKETKWVFSQTTSLFFARKLSEVDMLFCQLWDYVFLGSNKSVSACLVTVLLVYIGSCASCLLPVRVFSLGCIWVLLNSKFYCHVKFNILEKSLYVSCFCCCLFLCCWYLCRPHCCLFQSCHFVLCFQVQQQRIAVQSQLSVITQETSCAVCKKRINQRYAPFFLAINLAKKRGEYATLLSLCWWTVRPHYMLWILSQCALICLPGDIYILLVCLSPVSGIWPRKAGQWWTGSVIVELGTSIKEKNCVEEIDQALYCCLNNISASIATL